MQAPIKLTLYGKADCSLCDKMKAVVDSLSSQFSLSLTIIDIESDAELLRKFGEDIPLLFYRGDRLARHKVHETVLRKKLENLLTSTVPKKS